MRDFKQRDCYFVTTYHDGEDENPAPDVQGYRHVVCLPEESASLAVLERANLGGACEKQYHHKNLRKYQLKMTVKKLKALQAQA